MKIANRFNMFDMEKYKKKYNIEIKVDKDYTLVTQYLNGGEIYFNVKNDFPNHFNRMKFERQEKQFHLSILDELMFI